VTNPTKNRAVKRSLINEWGTGAVLYRAGRVAGRGRE
jgi:hypothetical protein